MVLPVQFQGKNRHPKQNPDQWHAQTDISFLVISGI
jgi:hypothetical protein